MEFTLKYLNVLQAKVFSFLSEVGKVFRFAMKFFNEAFSRPLEWRELLRQCYIIGNNSLLLVLTTGFIMGLVLSLQIRPTMTEFGAESYMPQMIGIAIVREIGPMVTALICAGKIGSSIGAELGSMKVTEQIDAMEVAGTNPFKYLVVTRIWACTLMLPLLVISADAVALFGSFIIENLKGDVSGELFFSSVFENLVYEDIIPASIKSVFFGFAIGLIGCYKGYNSKKGTAGVGKSANSAVVNASLLLFIIDFFAVIMADVFFEI